jgi:glycosyltransferase involved in cell wall biosynthesis
MKRITVFTPTFNRAYCLHQVYESLLRQSCQDFIWLVVDDGSTDNTGALVQSWIDDRKIEIHYVYQNNLGMHGGYNTAYSMIDTELNVCMDSDDFFTDQAIEMILKHWDEYGNDSYAGLVGLDATLDGKVLGAWFPQDLKSATLEDLYHKYKINGDKKLVYRTAVVKSFPPYPIYPGESFVPLGSLYVQIDKQYELLCLNEILCLVEYMEDGSTRNIFRQYRRHPRGFRYSRVIEMKYSGYAKVKIKAIIHFIANSLQLKEFNYFGKNKYPILTYLLFPLGLLLYFYIIRKNKLIAKS